MKSKYLLDTCALIWWTLDQDRLSTKAREACSELLMRQGLVSAISIWEIGIKIKNKKLDIGMTINTYLSKLKQLGCLTIIPVDENILVKNLGLNWKNRDTADRVIVATAMMHSSAIITADKTIQKYYKKTIW